jgi:uncharacterized protein
MNTPALNKKSIFAIAAGDYFDRIPDELFMVYSPLANKLVLANAAELKSMEECARDHEPGRVISGEIRATVADLLKYDRLTGYTSPEVSINALTKLSVLPNYSCNFSCSYCYAASGRSQKVLDRANARAAIDFFIDPGRLTERNLYLAILGGGEPLLSREVVGSVVAYARERASDKGFNLDIGLTTNGSIITNNTVQFLKKHNVAVSISFEILEDVQNSQRQQYGKVCTGIDRLIENDVEVTFKSIITNQNVNRLEEMVAELIRRFPSVKKLKLQPVDDDAIFRSTDELAQFYRAFTRNFLLARDLGEKHKIDVYCLAYKNIDRIMEHFCGGEICLTPEGTISICHRISSPQEVHYKDFIYGDMDTSQNIIFDKSKFDRLIGYNIHNKKKCLNCFARFHCGGGCLAQSYTYGEDKLNVICDWTRDFFKHLLIRRLEKICFEESHMTLQGFINS